MKSAGGDRLVGALRHVPLAVVIDLVSPAGDGAVVRDGASVIPARSNGLVGARRGSRRPRRRGGRRRQRRIVDAPRDVFLEPAGDFSLERERACVMQAGGDGSVGDLSHLSRHGVQRLDHGFGLVDWGHRLFRSRRGRRPLRCGGRCLLARRRGGLAAAGRTHQSKRPQCRGRTPQRRPSHNASQRRPSGGSFEPPHTMLSSDVMAQVW